MRTVVLGLILCVVGMAQSPNSIFLPASLDGDRAMAAKGDVTASVRLGYRYLTGTAGVIDINQAFHYFSSVARRSHAASAWAGYLAIIAPTSESAGLNGVDVLMAASGTGDVVGMTLLGRIYQQGKGVAQDTQAAKKLYQAAADHFALAKTFMAQLYLQSPDPRDRAQALTYLLGAASVGETSSMVRLADMYINGTAGVKDFAHAGEWLDNAILRADPSAAYQRGLLYQKGFGVEKNHFMAALMFERAAAAGYPPAQGALGMCYATGLGVKKDSDLAIHWLKIASANDEYAARQLKALLAMH